MNNTIYYRTKYLEAIHLKDKPITYNEHNHVSTYTIGLIFTGGVTLRCDGQETLFSSDSFFIIRPYQVHTLILPKTYDMLSFCIHKDLILKYKQKDLLNMITDFLSQLPITIHDSLLVNAIEALYDGKTHQTSNDVIWKCADNLCKNPENNMHIQTIASSIYFSTFHYIRQFKRTVGMTPHKFQLQNKVRKAQRLIEDGKPVAHIAADLGFYDQSHFIKYFKSIVGITPSAYKNSYKRLRDLNF